jgi:hypothetical protein
MMCDWFANQPKLPKQAPPQGRLLSQPAQKIFIPANKPRNQVGLPSTDAQKERQRVAANVVMHQFARSEVRSLNNDSSGLFRRVLDRLWDMPQFEDLSFEGISDLIGKLTGYLQQRDLTINFDATKWFSKPNEYTSYLQMYAKDAFAGVDAHGNPELRLPPTTDVNNPRKNRDISDDRVTFGKNIDSPERSGIARLMRTGGIDWKAGPKYFHIKNGQFNPKARQVFAALNYGRCPGGSTTKYGKSVLILNPGLKRNAIYYMGDTFDLDSSDRLTYGTLAGAFLTKQDPVFLDLLMACHFLHRLPNNDDPKRLLEAHIFGPVSFAHDVVRIRFAKEEADANSEVKKNARAFIRKFNIDAFIVGKGCEWGKEVGEVV